MFETWPNRESSMNGHRLSWELRSMEDLADRLALEREGWGALQGKPMTIPVGKAHHAGVLLVGPPFTVCWMMRPDQTTSLSVRFPLILWSEEDAIILPPDDAEGTAFYIDPPNKPGLHRDLFKTWGRRVAAALVMANFPMSRAVIQHLPREYLSDSEDDRPITPRSVSPSLPDQDIGGTTWTRATRRGRTDFRPRTRATRRGRTNREAHEEEGAKECRCTARRAERDESGTRRLPWTTSATRDRLREPDQGGAQQHRATTRITARDGRHRAHQGEGGRSSEHR